MAPTLLYQNSHFRLLEDKNEIIVVVCEDDKSEIRALQVYVPPIYGRNAPISLDRLLRLGCP